MVKFFKLQCAHEELKCVSVEVCCLQTSIHDEEAHILKITDELLVSNHPLASELKRQHWLWHVINELHLHCLDQITCHPQYVGSRGVGVQLKTLISDEVGIKEGHNNQADMDRAKQVGLQPAGDLLESELHQIGAMEYADLAALGNEEDSTLTEEMADLFLTFD